MKSFPLVFKLEHLALPFFFDFYISWLGKIGFNHDSDKPTSFLFQTVIDKLTIVFNLLS